MDKWLKRVWLVNGFLVFIVACWWIWQSVWALFPPSYDNPPEGPIVGAKLENAMRDTLVLQDISMTMPRQVGRTDYRFVQIKVKELTAPTSVVTLTYAELGLPDFPEYREYNSLEGGSAVNLVFMKADGSGAHLLLKRKALITFADIPSKEDTLQDVIVYRMVFRDTNGDGRLTDQDHSEFLVSTLNGEDLRQLSTPDFIVTRFKLLPGKNTLVLLARVRPGKKQLNVADWPQELFSYNLNTNAEAPLVQDTLLMKARQLLWGE